MSTDTSAASRASREAILSRVRAGLRDVPDLSPAADVPIPWEFGRATQMPDILARFVETVDDYKATVVRCPAAEVAQRVAQALTEHEVSSVVLPPAVPEQWRDALVAAGLEVRGDGPDGQLTRAELDATGAVVTAAAVGIAETGTIVLDHGPDQGRRAFSLIPDLHVCVVRADQVVSDVPEAVARLQAPVDAGNPLTWISGPSATSDIELARVEGVHGPRTLYVILADA